MVVTRIRHADALKLLMKVEELRVGQAEMPHKVSDGACRLVLHI